MDGNVTEHCNRLVVMARPYFHDQLWSCRMEAVSIVMSLLPLGRHKLITTRMLYGASKHLYCFGGLHNS